MKLRHEPAALAALALAASALLAGGAPAAAQEAGIYRTVMVQAAPGELLPLIELYKEERAYLASLGEEPALWFRHTQGDYWDLFLLYPMGSMSAYWAPERLRRIASGRTPSGRTGAELEKAIDALVAWRQDLFVQGPPPAEVKAAWDAAGFYHVEMYEGLAGKREELVKERHMENAYAAALGRTTTKVFTRLAGSSADGYTVGFYKDLKTYANQPESSREQQEAAAKAAGFRGADYIGPTLRTLILRHHDTMGVAIR
ncbi:MAG: hypothetical protein FIA95_10285 [Gemmatimonadetes bacterium]|nr:hypothetical protein [Gemmatimonadota bacterium]